MACTGKCARPQRLWLSLLVAACGLLFVPGAAGSAVCETASEMNPATRVALEATARRYFDLAAKGDSAALRQASIPAVSNDFSGIQAAVNENKDNFASAQVSVRPPYLLDAADNQAPLPRAEFFCGIYNSPDRVGFVIPNLPPGTYAFVTLDIASPKGPYMVSMVLEQQSNAWKLAGYYVRQASFAGRDAQWFWDKGREFKSKNQLRNAYYYYVEARQLLVPVDFMGTPQLDKLYDETQQVVPKDLPLDSPLDQTLNGRTYKLAQVFPVPAGEDLDLVVKYQVNDASNTAQSYQENVALIKALVARYPEFRDGFNAIVARAVDAAGREYGSLLAMKDIK
jgi:hypothetical protein